MELSDELLIELRPITVRYFKQLFQDKLPLVWSGDLTLNQIRVNNSIFTRGMLEGRPSSISELMDDLGMARTTVQRALSALAQHTSPAFPDGEAPYVEERVDPEDQRKKLYGFNEEAQARADMAIDDLTRLFVDTAMDIAAVLRKHGLLLDSVELMEFIRRDIPSLVGDYLQTKTKP